MSAQNLLITVFVIVLVVGGAWYFIEQNDDYKAAPNNGQQVTKTKSDRAKDLSGFGSFSDLIEKDLDLACDFEMVSSDTKAAVAGTIYISEGKLRADFAMEQAGEVYESHFLHDDTHSYTWTTSSLGTFAFMSPLDGTSGAGDTATVNRNIDFSQEVDYECRVWTVDEAVFLPPADVEFLTTADMTLEAAPETQPEPVSE